MYIVSSSSTENFLDLRQSCWGSGQHFPRFCQLLFRVRWVVQSSTTSPDLMCRESRRGVEQVNRSPALQDGPPGVARPQDLHRLSVSAVPGTSVPTHSQATAQGQSPQYTSHSFICSVFSTHSFICWVLSVLIHSYVEYSSPYSFICTDPTVLLAWEFLHDQPSLLGGH